MNETANALVLPDIGGYLRLIRIFFLNYSIIIIPEI